MSRKQKQNWGWAVGLLGGRDLNQQKANALSKTVEGPVLHYSTPTGKGEKINELNSWVAYTALQSPGKMRLAEDDPGPFLQAYRIQSF